MVEREHSQETLITHPDREYVGSETTTSLKATSKANGHTSHPPAKMESTKLDKTPIVKKRSSFNSDKSSPRGAKKEKLIPIPKTEIKTSVKKNQQWFISRAACSRSHVSTETKGDLHVVGDNDNEDSDVESHETVDYVEQTNGTSEISDVGNTSLNSVTGSSSVGDDDRIQPTTADDLSAQDISVPITATVAPITNTVEVKSSSPVAEQVENVLIEATEQGQPPTSQIHTQSAPESASTNTQRDRSDTDSSATFLGESVLGMTGDHRLKKQIDVLMKARAKLEGQLEVMAVESKAALQQRAVLQVIKF